MTGGRSWDAPKGRFSNETLETLDLSNLRANLESASATASAALADARASGDLQRHTEAACTLVDCLQRTGDLESAERSAASAVAFTEGTLDDHVIAAALLTHATVSLRLGDAPRAKGLFGEAMSHAERADDILATSLALTQLALLQAASGLHADALEKLDRAFSLGRDHRLTTAKGHALAAVTCLELSTFAARDPEYRDRTEVEVLRLLGRAQLLHERAGDVEGLGRTYNNFGALNFLQGRHVTAIPFFERALDLLADGGDLVTLLGVLNNNVRAFELHYLDRAGEFRDKMQELAGALREPDIHRLGDLTAWPAAALRETAPTETFASSLFIAEPVLLIPMLRHHHTIGATL